MSGAGSELPAELVERMVALVRDLHADHLLYDLHDRQQDFCKRTAEIVALLPKPVDPDLVEARAAVAEAHDEPNYSKWCSEVLAGQFDDCKDMQVARIAIKRGRELAQQAPSHAA